MVNFAVIIPTYNEKENIEKLIQTIFLSYSTASVIIVDDSSDGTSSVVERLGKKYKKLYLIKRIKKSGRGSAVIEGFTFALSKTKSVLFIEMDADFSHNPEEIRYLINNSAPKTVVIASRYLKKSQIIDWLYSRKVASKLANILIRFLLQTPVIDNTNGYRCYTKNAIQILVNHTFISHGFITLSEEEFLLKKKGFAFIEIPSIFINRKKGKSSATIGEVVRSLINLFRIKFLVH